MRKPGTNSPRPEPLQRPKPSGPRPCAGEPSGMEIAQREADEAAGDQDPRDRVWGMRSAVDGGVAK